MLAAQVESLLSGLDRGVADDEYREELRRSLKQLVDVKFALDESAIVAITDRRGKIRYVNDKFCEISGYERSELIGQDHRLVNSGYHGKSFMKELWTTISSGRVWRGEIKNRGKTGREYWVDTTIVPFADGEGHPYQYLAIRHEVTRLKETEAELQSMLAQMMQIQEEERRRFSRDLHDGIGQSLFYFKITIDRLLAEREDEGLSMLEQQVSQLMSDVRGLAWELRPSVLDDLGVVPALRTYIEHFEGHYGIQVRFDCELKRRPALLAETTIYRVVQEALTNIGKYAGVSEAYVSLRETDGLIKAVIRDKGVGFTRASAGSGVGLFSMEERARAVSGELKLHSEPGHGTTVTLTVPVG
ncbi:PAS domain-containing sensor histidine kinase [Cohnella sp. JJ-181]|uniref:PAS domain-containing sensor histidine kinase n=1 Tax=Cohnella rhizoplanae TaxID=2974897 RepID=UPI00232B4AF8|nr:PAS domain S-box protein [Cohnella sp. JJ-181]